MPHPIGMVTRLLNSTHLCYYEGCTIQFELSQLVWVEGYGSSVCVY